MDRELTQTLISWIRDTVESTGGKGVVFGISGGIDSSVIAVLCKSAFPDNSMGLIMPCYSDRLDREHAELVANKFKIPVKVVALDKAFDSLLRAFPDSSLDTTTGILAQGNIKSRLRMLTLYYYANSLSYLVIGSGNRCELTIGYFTKYGDGGVDILPISNLVKGHVKDLAFHLGIPEVIINKAPSAGLRQGQTDEAEMGFSYYDLDNYLMNGKLESIEITKRIEAMINRSWHKLSLPLSPPAYKKRIRITR